MQCWEQKSRHNLAATQVSWWAGAGNFGDYELVKDFTADNLHTQTTVAWPSSRLMTDNSGAKANKKQI